MNSVKKLDVIIDDIKIGTLAVADNHLCAFEYSDEWLAKGYSISPFSLPLEKKVFIPKAYTPFEGIFGIFADSLPDGWGRLLVDRLLMKNKINPYEVDAINRLAIVGKSGMGALEYYPENRFMQEEEKMSLDEIAAECEKIFETVCPQSCNAWRSLEKNATESYGNSVSFEKYTVLAECNGVSWRNHLDNR